MIRALISIGTNSTRLLILDGERRIAADSRGTRIGTGIAERGAIDPHAAARTLDAIGAYVAAARDVHAEQIDAIATSGLRRASDADAFSQHVATRVGIAPRIISGDEEASWSFLGATRAHAGEERIGVLDVGGGSTELAVDAPAHARAAARVAFTMSVEAGAVRLSERHRELFGAAALHGDARRSVECAARTDAAALVAPFAAQRGIAEMIAVGGTAFTAALMIARGKPDGTTITRAAIAQLLDDLLGRDLEARKALPHIRPQRADILPAGLLVIDEACAVLGVDRARVSEADLLLGYLTSNAFRAVPLLRHGG